MAIQMIITLHAINRSKERLHIKTPSRAYREMERAFQKGHLIAYTQTTGEAIYLFNNIVYVFNILVTAVCKIVTLITVFRDSNKQYASFL